MSLEKCRYADQSRPEENQRSVFINTADNAWAQYTYADSKLANHSMTIERDTIFYF